MSGLIMPLVPKGTETLVGRTRIIAVQDSGTIRRDTDVWGIARDFVKHALTDTGNALFEDRIDSVDLAQFKSAYFEGDAERPFQRPMAILMRKVALELPFQPVANRDAVFAIATIESHDRKDRVAVLISGPSQLGFSNTNASGPMLDQDREEVRSWFALVDLTRRLASELEQNSPPKLPEIHITIPTGPGHRGEWTIESVRNYAAERLQDYEVRREHSVWTATPKLHAQKALSVSDELRDKFVQFIKKADHRFNERRSQSQDEIAKQEFGRWVIAHQLVPEPDTPVSLRALPHIVRNAKGSEVGWPIGIVQTRPDAAPVLWDDGLEAWVISKVMHPSLDYWYAKSTGFFYQTRALEEDLEIAPGHQVFDVTLPIWRMGEAILHAWRMAKAYGTRTDFSQFYARYEGLAGRILWSHRPEIRLSDKYIARTDSWSNEIQIPTGISLSVEVLAELTYKLLNTLYEKFDLFDLPYETYLTELRSMIKG